MSKIKIKNFGPIKEGYMDDDGFIDIKKVTVFIGDQGSGKSTVAKLVSIFMWVEKALNRGDVNSLNNVFFHNQFKYHRIYDYLNDKTTIEYHGDRCRLRYSQSTPPPEVNIVEGTNYQVPKIMYVPAERNFLSVVENANEIIKLPESLFAFAIELKNTEREFANQEVLLPIPNTKFRYDKEKDISEIIGDGYKLKLEDVSSGFQSMVPLYVVSKYLSEFVRREKEALRELIDVKQYIRRDEEIRRIVFDKTLNDDERDARIREIDSKYISSCFINIVEEPQQNLFPKSQRKILNSLLEFNNMSPGNKLIITTHSPYLINYLTLAVEADKLKLKVNTDMLTNRLNKIVPLHSTINGKDLIVYQLDENEGTIGKLGTYDGLPSDENYLNESLGESNELFSQLLEIQRQV